MKRGYFLQNINGKYLKVLDTANGKLEFTEDVKEAKNYIERPGGGNWDANNEKAFLDFHFGEEYGDEVKTLASVYREWEDD